MADLRIKAKIASFEELNTDENLIHNFEECLETDFTGEIEDICMRLSVLETYIGELSKEEIEKNKEKFITFYEYFCDNFGDVEEVLEETQRYPMSLYLGKYFLEEEEFKEIKEEFKKCPKEIKENAEILSNYIWNIKERRNLTLYDDQGISTLELFKNIRKDEVENTKQLLEHMLRKAFLSEESELIFKYKKDKSKKGNYINGFRFQEGKIEKIEINDLVDTIEYHTNDIGKPLKNTDFPQIATIKLKRRKEG